MRSPFWDYIVPVLVVLGFLIVIGLLPRAVLAHDMEHPEFDEWYASLMQPDNPTVSCCGKADGYWCDVLYTRDGKNYCKITDDRIVMGRVERPVGMEIEVPDNKLMDGHKTRGNPTGHSVVFLSGGEVPVVFCYVMDTGI